MDRSQQLDAELARWADENRAWGLYQLNVLYARVDERNLDRSFAVILPLLLGLYAAMVIRTLDTVDEYWHLKARLGGYYMRFDWRASRQQLLTQLPSGLPLENYMRRAPLGMKRLIADGVPVERAVEVSKARSAQVFRTVTHQLVRDTNGYRSDLLNFTHAAVRKPNLPPLTLNTVVPLIPQEFAPWLDELENLANERLAPDAVPDRFLQDVRDYRVTPKSRWRRVPSAGACGYCITLASRGSVYYSKEKARAADHANCRCEVVVNMGLPRLVISEADYRKFTERDADGNLRSWRISTVPGKARGYTTRYTYEYTLADAQRWGGFAVYRGDKPPIAKWGD